MTTTLKPFKTVRDILAEVACLHRDSAARFAAAACNSSEQRLGSLYAFLAERETEQLTALSRLQSSGNEALEGFVQSVPSSTLAEAIRANGMTAEFDAVVDAYRRRDQSLIRFCNQLADKVGPRAREVFASLEVMRQRNQERLGMALLEF